MLTGPRYTLACRNFLTHRAQARAGARVVLLYHPDDARSMVGRFATAAEELSVPLEARATSARATGSDLLAGMREVTADLTAEDSLIMLCGNELCLRLIRAPELGGITGLLDFTQTLSAAGTHATIDPVTEDTFVRLYAVDFDELTGFVTRLRAALEGATSVHVTCPSGTDLHLTPRHWVGEESGFELYTAPVEDQSEGRIVYCSLASPTLPALIAFVEAGRVTKLLPGAGAGEASEALRRSLARGMPAVRVVAELGIGTHPGAWLVDSFPGQMENETIRGTCHLDLGDNTWFGGVNHCEQHIGGIVWHPTIATERGPVLVGAELVTTT
jgi:hypothetical protein